MKNKMDFKITKLSYIRAFALLFSIFISACEQNKSTTEADRKNISKPLHRLADSDGNYALPDKNNRLSFPRDHAPHKNYRQEWWYLTANLLTEDGRKFASQWTLFRVSVDGNHWYFAHAALADEKEQESAFRNGREEFANIEIKSSPFIANIDEWSWQSTQDFLPAKLSYGNFEGSNNNDWQVEFTLSGKQEFYLQGQQGFSQKHTQLAIASHYYSHPFIDVSGRVLWQGQWVKVTGSAWFDREWGSQMLAPDQQGWDWFSLRLTDDLALMVYRIRSTKENFVYGSLMHRDGRIETLSKKQISIRLEHQREDTYPNRFTIALPEHNINLNINIVNNKQVMRFGIEYFEGMVTFDGSHQGVGFVEMTGYQ